MMIIFFFIRTNDNNNNLNDQIMGFTVWSFFTTVGNPCPLSNLNDQIMSFDRFNNTYI